MPIILSEQEKERFEKWAIENIDDTAVPLDEGNGEALLFNIVHLIRGDATKYSYKPEQDKEINLWLYTNKEDNK